MSLLLKPCLDCGELSSFTRCDEHRPPTSSGKASASARGYDSAWSRLSRRARRLQPFCSDCGTSDDLTVDHSPAAWQAKAEGRQISLDLVDVVCRGCNARRGRARPWGEDPQPALADPWVKAEFRSQTGLPSSEAS